VTLRIVIEMDNAAFHPDASEQEEAEEVVGPTTVERAAREPWRITREAFSSFSDLWAHQDLRDGARERRASILDEGMRGTGAMADSVQDVEAAVSGTSRRWIFAQPKAGAIVYLFTGDQFRTKEGETHYLRQGEKPYSALEVEYDGQSLHEAAVSQAVKAGKPVPAEVLSDYPHLEGRLCEWFVLCDQPAMGLEPHPVLGFVPICRRCVDGLMG